MKLDIEKIKYIKFTCTDINGNEKNIKASVKKYGTRDIFACAKFDESLKITTPQNILLKIICSDGIYKTESSLKFITKEEPYIFFTIETPDDTTYEQNREFFRVKIPENVILENNEQYINCTIYDISANGIKLIIPNNLNIINDIVNVDILFTPKNIKTKAQYIRSNMENNLHTASFRFMDLPEQARDIISQKCIRKQLEDRKNSLL